MILISNYIQTKKSVQIKLAWEIIDRIDVKYGKLEELFRIFTTERNKPANEYADVKHAMKDQLTLIFSKSEALCRQSQVNPLRKEYIKCGKQICQHEHGPYYYAYWKDPENKKLKKKYIGDHMPNNEELNNDCNNNNQILQVSVYAAEW